jgi:hypothetical protein
MIKKRAKNLSLLLLSCLAIGLTPACSGRLPASVAQLPSAEESDEAGEESAEAEAAVAAARAVQSQRQQIMPQPQMMPQQMPMQQMMPQPMMPQQMPQNMMAPAPSVQVRPEMYANPYLPNTQFNRMAAPGMPPQTPGVNGSYGPVPQGMPQYGYAQTAGMLPQPGYPQQQRRY